MMSRDEVLLAMRIIGLRGTSFNARKNYWERRFLKDRPLILSLQDQGLAETLGNGWKLTGRGIEQLKLQIGEFTFS